MLKNNAHSKKTVESERKKLDFLSKDRKRDHNLGCSTLNKYEIEACMINSAVRARISHHTLKKQDNGSSLKYLDLK